jgi:osmotically inducible lipoprotein OsmB
MTETDMKSIVMTVAIAAVFGIAGCTSMTPKQQGTASGAAIGAVAGAGIVALTGGSAWTGAAVGAVAGGVAGHIKADREEEKARQQKPD